MTTNSTIFWLIQNLTNVPAHDDWLTPGDLACLARMRFPKRRVEWRLGRWTAKCALAAYFENGNLTGAFRSLKVPTPLRSSLTSIRMRGGEGTITNEIEIRAAADGAPEPFVNDKPIPITLSISHRSELGFCAVNSSGLAVGCDLELIEQRSDHFVADYFTPEEQNLVMQASKKDRTSLIMLIWSAKESALKALRQGLRLDTRGVIVAFEKGGNHDDWNPLTVRQTETSRSLRGWWRLDGKFVQTIVAEPLMKQPVALRIC